MRVDVKKFLFVGFHGQKDTFFEKAQDAGIIDFIDPSKNPSKEVPQDIEDTVTAIKVLRGLPPAKQEDLYALSDADEVTKKILHYKKILEKHEEEERVIKLEKARIEIFGDFSLEDIDYIQKEGHRYVQFFFAKKDQFNEDNMPDGFIRMGTEHGLDYFVAITNQPVQYSNMIEMKIDQPLGVLEKRLAVIKKEDREVEVELKKLVKYNKFLHKALIAKMNDHSLVATKNSVADELDGSIFTVMGWVPVDKIDQLEEFTQSLDVSFEEVRVEPFDFVPTYLENDGADRIGEDLVHIYDTPSHTDNDPSLWVLISFAVFFAIIINDGGYGFIFLAIALYMNYKFSDIKQGGKRALKLFFILTASCIIWGFMSNSFFGIELAQDSPLRKVSVLNWLAHKKADYHMGHQGDTYQEIVKRFPEAAQAKDSQQFLDIGKIRPDGQVKYEIQTKFYDNIMMELALLIGSIHISLSLLRYVKRNWAAIGWVAFIWGCYLYFPEYLNATSLFHYAFGIDKAMAAQEGLLLMGGGLSLAVVLGLVQHKSGGILEIANVVQVFSDVLSYLRLYALGLAGAIMSATINDIAGGIGAVFAVLLILIGHAFNIVLSAMGGVIHGLRLNFLEWYHYSFEGGGKMFKPLKKKKID